jgi:hypothetical protein
MEPLHVYLFLPNGAFHHYEHPEDSGVVFEFPVGALPGINPPRIHLTDREVRLDRKLYPTKGQVSVTGAVLACLSYGDSAEDDECEEGPVTHTIALAAMYGGPNAKFHWALCFARLILMVGVHSEDDKMAPLINVIADQIYAGD